MRNLCSLEIEPAVVTDTRKVLELYTPEVHAMYREMVARSDVKLEVLPLEYFHQSKLRLSPKPISSPCSWTPGSWRSAEPAGRDDLSYIMCRSRLPAQYEGDLYWNLMYAGLDRAFRGC